MGQTKSGLAAQINPLFQKCRCGGPHSQHLAHQALHPSEIYTPEIVIHVSVSLRRCPHPQTIRKPHPKSITQAARKNRPRDFDSIISGGLDHLRACCTTLRWYLSLVVDASWVLARRDDFLFFFSTKWGQEARLKERMVTCTSENGIKNIRHMVDTSENPSVEPVDFWGILIFLQNGTFCDHQGYHMVDMNQGQVINVVWTVFFKKNITAITSLAVLVKKKCWWLLVNLVWAVDAWCWWSVPGEHEAVFVFHGA